MVSGQESSRVDQVIYVRMFMLGPVPPPPFLYRHHYCLLPFGSCKKVTYFILFFFTSNAFPSSLHPSILGELIGEGRRLQHILGW